jgi:DNA-binding SARP family transcriptional activator/ABC-type glycerol-3-phosphate transport system substrate-binding protein/tRNA A-37 threonylcarbamoyl transferase component Bud32
VEYRVLGNFEVVRDGHPVDLGAFRQRALLALLLTEPNSVFSTDRILDELWGAEGGIDKQNALWVYVSGLRKALEPERAKRTEGTILLTRPPGYLIEVGPDEVDALRFERMVFEGRALADVDPAAASLVLGEALALWRGRAFEDFTYEAFAHAEIARLEELRLEAVELRVDADLERGLARELISELESLVRQHPLNERLSGKLMLALYRSSRQAEALRAYRLLKSRLGEELGIEPSSWIRQLESQIVTGDESLEVPARLPVSGLATSPGPAVRGYELREHLGGDDGGAVFRAYQPAVGREVAIKVIRADLANDPGFIRRFQTEAQIVATLEHPHIVPLYDYWREPDAAYLVTRLMSGSLTTVLERGPLTPSQTITMIEQLGDALQTAHRAGVVHGDIKADNVLLDGDGNAYLSDFGIAVGDAEVSPSSDVHGLGVLIAEALTGTTDELDGLRRSLPDQVARVIDRATGVDASDRYGNVHDLATDLREALSGDTRPSLVTPIVDAAVGNPYKGLRAFDAVDAVDFFGRERLVERLIARLGVNGTRGRFIAVVGPSGSGKSSAVRGGLIPAVRRGALPLSGSWFTIEMTPAPHPFEQLEEALLGVALDSPPSLLDLLTGDRGIQRALDEVLPNDGSQVLLLIDQFEELFTQVDSATANCFIASIVSAVTDARGRLRVVATLRADFYDRPLQHRGLGELLREGTEVITPMTPSELEQAITMPAQRRGVTFEPALLAALLHDVTDRPGALPLLQYTLTELFESRRVDRVTHAAYQQLGGISGALVKRADGLLSSLGDDSDVVARQVFLRLITLTEGGEDTRRRVLRSELEDLDVDRRLLRSVLDTFGRHRLLSFDRDPLTRSPTVEISHEALLTEWTRLRDWIDGARDDVRAQRRLAEAHREWVDADRADAYLLRGGLLEQLQDWSNSTSLQLSGPERAFLDASAAERAREAEEILLRENRATVAELRQRRRGRQLAGVGLVTVLVAVLGVFGAVQWRSSVSAKRDVDDLLLVNRLVTASRAQLAKDSALALLLAMQSLRQTVDLGYATEEAVDAVHFALQELGVQYDVDAATRVAARPGSQGPVGVYVLPPKELIELAESSVSRTLTDSECQEFLSGACPAEVEVPEDLELQRGLDAYAPADLQLPLEGTTVTICLCNNFELDTYMAREFLAFTERTGIKIETTPLSVEDAQNLVPAEPERRPDVVVFNQQIPEWSDNRAIDIAQFVDPATLRSDFGNFLLSFGTSDTSESASAGNQAVRAIPIALQPKGLVFYPKAEFQKAGYQIPKTWDELLALSDQIVADGGTPWCFGFESGQATGWPGTDFLESLVLRVGGVETYDAWTRGEIGFTNPAVMAAGRLADALVFKPGYVRGGTASINDEPFQNQLPHMLHRDGATGETKPECWLNHQAQFALTGIPAADRIGTDVDFFMLPPIEPNRPTPAIGTANFASALNDRPEVREFMRFAASPEWGSHYWAAGENAGFFSPNQRFDPSNYRDASHDPGADDVTTSIADATLSALRSDAFRMDASDQMPAEIGALTLEGGPGAFWQGMVDWVDGTRTIEEVFAGIDSAWAALDDVVIDDGP